jgi:hypothetical protein
LTRGHVRSRRRSAGTTSPSNSIIVAAREVLIPISLAPLKEFEVVLHLTFDELLNVNGSIDAMACEAVYCSILSVFVLSGSAEHLRGVLALQDLKILQVCVFGIDIKLDSGHRDIEINAVEDLAECRTAFQTVSRLARGSGSEPCCGGGSKLTQFHIARPWLYLAGAGY